MPSVKKRVFKIPYKESDKGSSSRRTPTMKLIKIAAVAAAAMLVAAAANAQNVDFSKVEITTVDLGNKTYMLVGQGGNITVAVGTDGIIMRRDFCDGGLDLVVERRVLPIKYLISTHYHRDHVDGNELFNKAGATIVGHDNLRIRLAAGTTNLFNGNKTPPAPPTSSTGTRRRRHQRAPSRP